VSAIVLSLTSRGISVDTSSKSALSDETGINQSSPVAKTSNLSIENILQNGETATKLIQLGQLQQIEWQGLPTAR